MECLINSSTRWKIQTPKKLFHKSSKAMNQFVYDEVAVYFTKEEWDCLTEEEKELYKNVMMENYQNLKYIGYVNMKPTVISYIEEGEEPYVRDYIQPDENKVSIDSRTAYKLRKHNLHPKSAVSWAPETSEESSDSLLLQGSNTFHQPDMSYPSEGSDISQDSFTKHQTWKLHVVDKPIVSTQSSKQKGPIHHGVVSAWASEEYLDSTNLQGSDYFQQQDMPSTSEGSDLSLDLFTEFESHKLQVSDITTGIKMSAVPVSSANKEQQKVNGHFVKPVDLQATSENGPQLANIHCLGNMKVPAAVLLEKSVQQIQLLINQISSQGDSKSARQGEYITALNELRREIQIFNIDRELYETRIFRSQLLQLKREKLALQRERLEFLKHNSAMHQNTDTSSEEE